MQFILLTNVNFFICIQLFKRSNILFFNQFFNPIFDVSGKKLIGSSEPGISNNGFGLQSVDLKNFITFIRRQFYLVKLTCLS